MESNTIPPFFIGQKIVRIAESNDFNMKKGQKCVVNNIRWCCDNAGWRIDVGIPQSLPIGCQHCLNDHTDNCIYLARLFAPIIENFEAISFEKVNELEKASVN
jgi:hypothetical protein